LMDFVFYLCNIYHHPTSKYTHIAYYYFDVVVYLFKNATRMERNVDE
jgi:hypothetical protein